MPRQTPRRLIAVASAGVCLLVAASLTTPDLVAQTDLDAFMRQVLARRDDNWKKLQQYVLDEREQIDLRGPTRLPIWGERREYTWYIRDGFFVRSPVKFNGVDDRRSRAPQVRSRLPEAPAGARKTRTARDGRARPVGVVVEPADRDPRAGRRRCHADVDGLLRQTREPRFISSAYFLRFKFEEGKYALVGRETLDGRDVLRIEYYPRRMFGGTDRRRSEQGAVEPGPGAATPSSSG